MMKVLVKLVTKLIPDVGKAIKKFWDSLDEVTMISKRELFLEIVATALAGIVLGMLLTPKKSKSVTIGSHNCGNGHNVGNGKMPDEDEE